MKRLLLFFFMTSILLVVGGGAWYLYKMNPASAATPRNLKKIHTAIGERFRGKASSLKDYARAHQYNSQFCFLVDMSRPSGSNRFFVYNLVKDSLMDAGLVTHGGCNGNRPSGRRYSNTIGGGCTSLGRYRIGKPYNGKFGLAYKLHGLDSSNSNAFKRFVVLHSHSCVPNGEVEPLGICNSEGCPTVSEDYLKKLATLINGSKRPVLLYIFE